MNFLKNLAVSINGIASSDVDIPSKSGTDIVNGVLNVTFFILGAVAVIMIIISGYHYLTSAGDPGKAKKAMSTLLYSVIGLVVAISAYVIVSFVIGKI